MTATSYTKFQKLGEGTYCSVFRAVNSTTNEVVALKIVRMDQEEDGIPGSSLREVSLLRALSHPNVINLLDVLCEGSKLQLIFEFMDRDLKRYLEGGRRTIKGDLLRSYTFQLLCGLLYLHSNGVVHQNIRPENLLIKKNGFLKIGDFGSAVSFQRPLTPIDGKMTMLWYRAPELVVDSPEYDHSIDIWSCGCVIAEMIKGTVLFGGDSPVDQLMKICKVIGTPTDEDWPDFGNYVNPQIKLPKGIPIGLKTVLPNDVDPLLLDLLSRMLTLNPSKRITAKEAVHHEYFKNLQQTLIDICLPCDM
ncbi:Cell division control protein 2 like protein [Tritrichomonas foetus]|uniref:cyclin-dependent kinase n=1 Tax=Tritrichomonas foetus TaxID=1144522 RepID=A0A1J4JC12_9EUKA|nr:Cell division control protein 2 like protein [Tritrichomonas foetus]|eukprot:OHS94796.1 Cell division control protein 2 like protein [Tritrichomonas foetus]